MLRNIYTKVIHIYKILKRLFEFVLFESLVSDWFSKKRIHAHNLEMSLHHYFILGEGQQYISKNMKNIKDAAFRSHGN